MKKFVALNHKMYLDFNNIKDYIKEVKDHLRTDIDIVMCPSPLYIPYFIGKYNFKLGAQNLSKEFITGEVSGQQLKSLGVNYVIIGHSERKQKLNESPKTINEKIIEAINNNLIPIICVGETKEERQMKKTGDIILKQLKEYLKNIEVKQDIIIAYEPIWAIGTGVIPTNEEIEEVIDLIKNSIFRVHQTNIRVLYGGSVNEKNIKTLEKINNLDGYLLGKVSTEPSKLLEVLNSIN